MSVVETPEYKLREAKENARVWRNLALQFDEHRMNALSFLRFMVEDPEAFKEEVRQFLVAPPLSGEKVLAERIATLATFSGGQGSLREADERAAFEAWWPTHWPNRGSVPDIVFQGWMGRASLGAVPPETGDRT